MVIIPKGHYSENVPTMTVIQRKKWVDKVRSPEGGRQLKLDLGMDGTNPSIKDVVSRGWWWLSSVLLLGLYRHLLSS